MDYFNKYKKQFPDNIDNVDHIADWLEGLKYMFCKEYILQPFNSLTFTEVIVENKKQVTFDRWFNRNYKKYPDADKEIKVGSVRALHIIMEIYKENTK